MSETEPTEVSVRANACVYILHMLLQRMEQQQPGLLDNMIEGVVNDCAARPDGPASSEPPTGIGAEALRILRLANDQLKIPWEPLRRDQVRPAGA